MLRRNSYRPTTIEQQKIKKTDKSSEMTITMVKNPDIIASIASLKTSRPFTVGFAAETQDVEQYAKAKLIKKNLDMICANDVSIQGQGFNSEDNAINVYWKDGQQALPLNSKRKVAEQIITLIATKLDD